MNVRTSATLGCSERNTVLFCQVILANLLTLRNKGTAINGSPLVPPATRR